MKRISMFFLRCFYLVMIRCLEREQHDQMTALGNVRTVNDFKRISMAAFDTREQLAHYRTEYSASLPVGVRVTWEGA